MLSEMKPILQISIWRLTYYKGASFQNEYCPAHITRTGCLKEEPPQLVQLGNSLHSYLLHRPFILWSLPCEKLVRMNKVFLRSVLESDAMRVLMAVSVTMPNIDSGFPCTYVHELLSSYSISKLHDCWWRGFICYLITNSVLLHYFILIYPVMQFLFKRDLPQKGHGLSLTFSMTG